MTVARSDRMDRNLVLLNRNIARLRRDVRQQSSEIER
jgi:hypothetical protein